MAVRPVLIFQQYLLLFLLIYYFFCRKEIKKEPIDEIDGPSDAKKIKKEESSIEKTLKSQNKLLFGNRDKLKALPKSGLTTLLEYNQQEIPSGVENVI